MFQQSGADAVTLAVHWLGVAGLVVGGRRLHLLLARSARPARCRSGSSPSAASCCICALNLLTRDTSAAAQAFFAFPVLWAASHLRRGGVGLVTGSGARRPTALTLFLLLPGGGCVHRLRCSSAPSSS